MSDQHSGSSGLFSIFFVSMYTLFAIVYTCYHFCGQDEQTTQPVAKVGALVCVCGGGGGLQLWVLRRMLLTHPPVTPPLPAAQEEAAPVGDDTGIPHEA